MVMKTFKTQIEQEVGRTVAGIFESSADSVDVRLENFPKYVRRQALKRFLAMYEIFKLVLPVKGSVVECGVYRGFSVMSWAKLSTILEPENLTRRIYGFDTFAGFSSVAEQDRTSGGVAAKGDFGTCGIYDELQALIRTYDADRFLGHINKVSLIPGDVCQTIPAFLEENTHLLISLLYLDMDLYEPTQVALQHFVPRMPKGAVIAFDELDNPIWPGETMALLDSLDLRNSRIQRLEWDPYIGYIVL